MTDRRTRKKQLIARIVAVGVAAVMIFSIVMMAMSGNQ